MDGGRPHASHSSSSIRKAIDQVLYIRTELRKALDEIQEVIRTLDQAEREKTASEDEIEKLREALRGLHREPMQSRYRSEPSPRPARPPSSSPAQEPSEDRPADDVRPAGEEED
jgi:hypothetical protein